MQELSSSSEAKLKLLQESKSQELLKLKGELEKKEANVSRLNKQISDFCHQLDEREEGKGSLTDVLARVKLREREIAEKMRREREELLGTVAQYKSKLASCKVELAGTNTSLVQAQQECKQLRSSISSEVASHTKVASSLSELQLEYSEMVAHKAEVEIQLKEKTEEVQRVRTRLKESQEHCSTLQEELQLQNEVSASTTRSMEVKMKERVSQLQAKIDNLVQKLSRVSIIVEVLPLKL